MVALVLCDGRRPQLAAALSTLTFRQIESRTMPTKRLARDPNHKWVAGVCGGIARWLDADPDIVRLIYVLLSVVSAAFPGTLVYLILWAVMPIEE
jgi:phage shock protein C